jgi:hypothetical protein
VQVDPDPTVADGRELIQDALDDGRPQHGEQWLGQVMGDGSQPFAEAGRGEKDGERVIRHLQELSAR